MKYTGNKTRLLPDLALVFECVKEVDPTITDLFDPFTGSMSVSAFFSNQFNVHPSDANPELIDFFNYVKHHGVSDLPLDISRDDYNKAWSNNIDQPWLSFWYKSAASYRVKLQPYNYQTWYTDNKGNVHNNVHDMFNSVKKSLNDIQQLNPICKDYKDVEYKPGQLIYLDPPYNTKWQANFYNLNTLQFNHQEFLDWAIEMGKNHVVVLSEYNLPISRFIPVLECVENKSSRMSDPSVEIKQEFIWLVKRGLHVKDIYI